MTSASEPFGSVAFADASISIDSSALEAGSRDPSRELGLIGGATVVLNGPRPLLYEASGRRPALELGAGSLEKVTAMAPRVPRGPRLHPLGREALWVESSRWRRFKVAI